jgi:hypothetical protein
LEKSLPPAGPEQLAEVRECVSLPKGPPLEPLRSLCSFAAKNLPEFGTSARSAIFCGQLFSNVWNPFVWFVVKKFQSLETAAPPEASPYRNILSILCIPSKKFPESGKARGTLALQFPIFGNFLCFWRPFFRSLETR